MGSTLYLDGVKPSNFVQEVSVQKKVSAMKQGIGGTYCHLKGGTEREKKTHLVVEHSPLGNSA